MRLDLLARATRVALVGPARTEVLACLGGRAASATLLYGHGADLRRWNPELRELRLDCYAVLVAPSVRLGGAFLYAGALWTSAFLTVGRHTLCMPGVRAAAFRADCRRAALRLEEI